MSAHVVVMKNTPSPAVSDTHVGVLSIKILCVRALMCYVYCVRYVFFSFLFTQT